VALSADWQIEVSGFDVAAGVSHTPTSRAELMAGAHGRVEALIRQAGQRVEAWRYFVGLEGGFDVFEENGRRLVLLESWAYVRDEAGREAYGRSAGIPVPEALSADVLDRGVELSQAIDAYSGASGVRDQQGAAGVLTRNLIAREEAFRSAMIAAFAPFFNDAKFTGRGSSSVA